MKLSDSQIVEISMSILGDVKAYVVAHEKDFQLYLQREEGGQADGRLGQSRHGKGFNSSNAKDNKETRKHNEKTA